MCFAGKFLKILIRFLIFNFPGSVLQNYLALGNLI